MVDSFRASVGFATQLAVVGYADNRPAVKEALGGKRWKGMVTRYGDGSRAVVLIEANDGSGVSEQDAPKNSARVTIGRDRVQLGGGIGHIEFGSIEATFEAAAGGTKWIANLPADLPRVRKTVRLPKEPAAAPKRMLEKAVEADAIADAIWESQIVRGEEWHHGVTTRDQAERMARNRFSPSPMRFAEPPQMTLKAAVTLINERKRAMGDDMALSVTTDGFLKVMVEYG